uniref:U9-ctenitoxin-Pn1a n=1 Tax=Phoneutria nigriventer TaxID=6918 RepID=TX21C_PHONI|nr:RecName: Full=U9-ctenitoxin-Pn1a; Short=U9-CNTX-Pn1a; AltName: Full=Neurotoxin Pn3-3A; Flags: Precursor [Phoneutria nigriventer]
MWLKTQLFVLAIAVIALLEVHAEPESNDNNELVVEEARGCADAYKSCNHPRTCCDGYNGYKRACICSGSNCKCKKSLREMAAAAFGR